MEPVEEAGKGHQHSWQRGQCRVGGWFWLPAESLLPTLTPPHPTAAGPGHWEPGLVGLAGAYRDRRADVWASAHRLFDLEPDLLPLFQYNCRQFSSPEDCLSSPEFLDHIRKVR